MNTKEPFFLGLHIPKTAGSTLISLLRDKLGDQHFHSYSSLIENAMNGIPLIEEKLDTTKLKATFGHMVNEKTCLYFPNREIYFLTLLREPIKRTISHYYHTNKSKEDKDKVDLTTFLKSKNPNLMCDMITRRFKIFLDDSDTDLPLHQQALKILKAFKFVCLTEEFDSMINLLLQDMGISPAIDELERKNVTKKVDKTLRQDILDWEAIKNHNQEDIALYNYFLDARRRHSEARNPLGFCQDIYDKGFARLLNIPHDSRKILKSRFIISARGYKNKDGLLDQEILRTKQKILNEVLKLETFVSIQNPKTNLDKQLIVKLRRFYSYLDLIEDPYIPLS